MTSPAVFDRIHGRNAFSGLRTLLKNPELSYRDIGKKLGLTKQRISQLAQADGHRWCRTYVQAIDRFRR